MLYLMLVVVFSTLSKKWWFFLLLGWCKSVCLSSLYVCMYVYMYVCMYVYDMSVCLSSVAHPIPNHWTLYSKHSIWIWNI